MEAQIHMKVLTLFGNITRSDKSSVEWRLAERQLSIKCSKSRSWFIELKKIGIKYDILDLKEFLYAPLSKHQWKSLIQEKVHRYWTDKINLQSTQYTSIQGLAMSYTIGKAHPILHTISANPRDIAKIPIRLKIATGTYILQSNRAKFNQAEVSGLCRICEKDQETLEHFIVDYILH